AELGIRFNWSHATRQTKFPGRGFPDFLQIRMGKGFSSTNFVHWINGVESDSTGQQAGPDPDAKAGASKSGSADSIYRKIKNHFWRDPKIDPWPWQQET